MNGQIFEIHIQEYVTDELRMEQEKRFPSSDSFTLFRNFNEMLWSSLESILRACRRPWGEISLGLRDHLFTCKCSAYLERFYDPETTCFIRFSNKSDMVLKRNGALFRKKMSFIFLATNYLSIYHKFHTKMKSQKKISDGSGEYCS